MRRKLKTQCLRTLRNQFGIDGFRPGQEAAVNALLSGRDLLCVLPTGSGKSLCWQLPAVMQADRGWTLVVSPLIALMQDQVNHLNENGISCACINSLLPPEANEAALKRIREGTLKILFVSPERLQSAVFQSVAYGAPPWLMVVDEAHCIPQWGDSFREAYREIGHFIRDLPARPVMCAMTATADDAIRKSIVDELGMRRHKQVTLPVFRQNLHYETRTTSSKLKEMLSLIREADGRTVIFCRTRKRAEQLAEQMRRYGAAAAHYHAGMEREERNRTQERFSNGEIRVLAATTAFGMGVDIPDIRCIIHDWLPENAIDYVQQSGRAGRDGLDSRCIVLLGPNNLLRIRQRFGRLRAQNRRKFIRRIRLIGSEWKQTKGMLRIFLKEACISAALSRALGERLQPCGTCSACRRGPLLHDRGIPPLHTMNTREAKVWILRWQRDRLAETRGIRPGSVMTLRELDNVAAAGILPERLAPEDAAVFRRLADTMLRAGEETE